MKTIKGRVFFAALLALSAAAFSQENYSTWSHRKVLTINTAAAGAAIPAGATVLKYPLLVRLGAAHGDVFLFAKAGGADLRFTKADSSTRLKHQIESWDSAGKSASIWVLMDSLQGNVSNKTIRMFWGKSDAADSSKGSAVFDTANGFQVAYHMSEASGNLLDATANGNVGINREAGTDAAPTGGTQATVGAIGRGRSFNAPGAGVNDVIGTNWVLITNGGTVTPNIPKINLTNNPRMTLEAWVRGTSNNRVSNNAAYGFRNIIAKRDQFYLRTDWGVSAGVAPSSYNLGADSEIRSAFVVPDQDGQGEWVHMTGVRDTTVYNIFRNGVKVGVAAGTKNPTTSTNSHWALGAYTNTSTDATGTGRYWLGDMDEVRISNVARDSNYIKLNYESQKAASTVVTLAATQGPPPPAPTNLSYTADSVVYTPGVAITANNPTVTGLVTSYTIAPALPAGLTINVGTGVISGTPTAAQALTSHTVTATNAGGSTTKVLRIQVLTPPPEDYSGWGQNSSITVNTSATGMNVPGNVFKFPYLVRLDSNFNFAQARADGFDIRFSKSGGQHLKYQREGFDAATKRAEFWVLLDTVYGNNATQSFRMHWGRSAALDSSNGAAVFDTANGFSGVWHLSGASYLQDATINANHAQIATGANHNSAGPVDSASVIGRGRQFMIDVSATNPIRKLSVPQSPSLNNTSSRLTLSAWVYSTYWGPEDDGQTTGNRRVIKKGNGDGTSYGLTEVTNLDQLYLQINANTEAVVEETFTPINRWALVHGVYDGVNAKVYVDGILRASVAMTEAITATPMGANPALNADGLHIGGRGNTTVRDHFTGKLDEVRVSKAPRDSNWVRLEWMNQKLAAFAPIAPTIAYALAVIPANIGTAVNQAVTVTNGPVTSYSIAPALSNGLVFNTTTGAITGTPTATMDTTTYTVTGTSPVGNVTTTVKIVIRQAISVLGAVDGAGFSIRSFGKGLLFKLPASAAPIEVSITDVFGRMVWSGKSASTELMWEGLTSGGQAVGRGVYIIRMNQTGKNGGLMFQRTISLTP